MSEDQSASLLDRFGLSNGPQLPEVDSYVEQSKYLAFGISRKAWGGEPMINFISCRGDHHAISYSHLYGVKFNPSLGITIEFSDHVVLVRGRGLASSYEKLVMQRVVFIVEADRSTAALIPDDEPVVTELLIEQKREKSPDFKRMMEETP
ncbi:hypothetical protein [Rhodopirellula europaea]|uniref:Uncharacterized protein n=1 Tax=Rhodopirellula europaea 6C TaxID=1263867 RepID=M2AYN3_9BACT|nr:hypothetical protein [Rhodopirellula europaea]EMB15079.1 hypothetical protein RE6C_04181 [Rhodopirellula europaea 6C]